MPHRYWPFFDLVLRTGGLELRVVDDHGLAELAALSAEGVHAPDEMPFGVPWTRGTSPARERSMLQFYWKVRSEWSPQHWGLLFAVHANGVLVGSQGIDADDFGVLRSVHTGSWLGLAYQGRGIGKLMRAAVLHLAFAGLGAVEATSGAFADNPRSLGVSRALGYEPNGEKRENREGSAVTMVRLRLTREQWLATDRPAVEITGLEPCLPLLGAAAATATAE